MLAVGSNFEMSNVNTFSDYKSNFKSTKRINNINNLLRAAVSNFENVAPGGGVLRGKKDRDDRRKS